jgi:hypothetical protein
MVPVGVVGDITLRHCFYELTSQSNNDIVGKRLIDSMKFPIIWLT